MIPVLLRPAAAADAEDAYLWYEAQRRGLGDEYLDELSRVLEHVGERPAAYPEVWRGARRALLRRFPHQVIFRVVGNRALVVAVFHSSRDPRVWRRRSKS